MDRGRSALAVGATVLVAATALIGLRLGGGPGGAPVAGSSAPTVPAPTAGPGTEGPGTDPCAPYLGRTRKRGSLTIGSATASSPPLLLPYPEVKPAGLQGELVAALATRLGFADNQRNWFYLPWPAGGPVPPVDLWLDQSAAVPGPRYVLSAPYLDLPAVLVAATGSAAARTGTVAAARRLRLATVGGGAAERAARGLVPGPLVSPDAAAAATALGTGRVDAVVLDLAAAERVVRDGAGLRTVARVPAGPGPPDQLRFRLAKDDPLTGCVDRGLAALRADGTLARLQRTWPYGRLPLLR